MRGFPIGQTPGPSLFYVGFPIGPGTPGPSLFYVNPTLSLCPIIRCIKKVA